MNALFERVKKYYHLPEQETLKTFKIKILNNENPITNEKSSKFTSFLQKIVDYFDEDSNNDQRINTDEFNQKIKIILERYLEHANSSYSNLSQKYFQTFGKQIDPKKLKNTSWIELHYQIETTKFIKSNPNLKIEDIETLLGKYGSYQNVYWNLRTKRDRNEWNKYCFYHEQINSFDDIKKFLNFKENSEPKSIEDLDSIYENLIVQFKQKIEEKKNKYNSNDLRQIVSQNGYSSIQQAKEQTKISDPSILYWALKTKLALNNYNNYFKTSTQTFENLRDTSNEDWETLY